MNKCLKLFFVIGDISIRKIEVVKFVVSLALIDNKIL